MKDNEKILNALGDIFKRWQELLAGLTVRSTGAEEMLRWLRLGLVVNFLSHPVVNGFTNAAAIIIATSQLSKMFGVNVSPKESELAFVDSSEALALWRVIQPNEPAPATVVTHPTHLRLAGVLQQRWWWWMVLGGLLLLFAETLWAGARSERA